MRGGKLPDDAAERVKAAIDLRELIAGDGIALKREGREWVACCPFHDEKSASFKVNPIRNVWHCFGCGVGGDAIEWVTKRHGLDFVDAVRLLATKAGIDLGDPSPSPSPGGPTKRRGIAVGTIGGPAGGKERPPKEEAPRGPTPFDWRPDLDVLCRQALLDEDGRLVLDYLRNERKLSRAAIDHFRLGALVVRRPDGTVRGRFLAIPCYENGALTTVRFRSVPGPCLNCAGSGRLGEADCRSCKGKGQTPKFFAHCPGRDLPLYNVDSLPADPSATIGITEGELDVVAGWDQGMTGPVVSGTGGAGSFEDRWYDRLEPYRGFLLLYDGDAPGEEGAGKVADRLGRYRCSRPTLPRKDLGDCLKDGVPAAEVLAACQHARPMVTTKFASVGSYRAAVEARIARPELLVGLPTGSAKLDRCIGGWRPGLFVITGPTGHGKTSFTAWAAREQALRGVPSLVTCFEQGNVPLAEKYLRMQIGGDFTKNSEAERGVAWDALDAMPAPIHFLDHYGLMKKAELFDAIRYVVRRLDVRWVLIDHAGYVDLGDDGDDAAGVDRFMIELNALGVNEEVCLATVCHPNRMWTAQGRSRPAASDLKGGSGIEQNAQAVLCVVRNPVGKNTPNPSATLHADKVRSEFGMPGSSCTIAYDPLATSYADDWAMTPSARRGLRPAVSPPPDAPGEEVVIPTKREKRRVDTEGG